jgi:hypothetical protein
MRGHAIAARLPSSNTFAYSSLRTPGIGTIRAGGGLAG